MLLQEGQRLKSDTHGPAIVDQQRELDFPLVLASVTQQIEVTGTELALCPQSALLTQAGLEAERISSNLITTRLKVLDHPHIAIYRRGVDRQVTSIRRRNGPQWYKSPSFLFPENGGIAFQIHVQQGTTSAHVGPNKQPSAVYRPN